MKDGTPLRPSSTVGISKLLRKLSEKAAGDKHHCCGGTELPAVFQFGPRSPLRCGHKH
ncbi:MAG: hypothetical protein ACLUZ4_02460 [Christensenellaceae bacterium]